MVTHIKFCHIRTVFCGLVIYAIVICLSIYNITKILKINVTFAGVTCRDPGTPSNGRRQLETLQDGGIVHYSCYNGYRLVGEAKRTCYNGQWTGSLPTCIGT